MRRRVRCPRLAVPVVITGLLASGAAVAPAQDEELAVRGVGRTALSIGKPAVNTLTMHCVVAGENTARDCIPWASGSMKVDAATKRKLGLPSATIARAASVAPCPPDECLAFTASKTVRAKLKKVQSVTVTYTLKVTRPVTETVRKKLVLATRGSGRRMAVRSSGDTYAISDSAAYVPADEPGR